MIKRLFASLKKAVFPEGLRCISCGREAVTGENGFCTECEMGLEAFNSAPPIEGIADYTAAWVYNDVTSRPIKKLKYNGARYLGKALGGMIEIPKEWHIDAVVPVPLYYRREWKRGFNQSRLIAEEICRRGGYKLAPELLIRYKDTKQQARLTEAGRKRNLKCAFAADEACRGLDILLIDDVRTTGATLGKCAEALLKEGAKNVYAATVCFAKPHPKARKQ